MRSPEVIESKRMDEASYDGPGWTVGWWIKGSTVHKLEDGQEHWEFAVLHADEMGVPESLRDMLPREVFDAPTRQSLNNIQVNADWESFLFGVIHVAGWTRVRLYVGGGANIHVPRMTEKYLGPLFDWMIENESLFGGNVYIATAVQRWAFDVLPNEGRTSIASIKSGLVWKELGIFESRGVFARLVEQIVYRGWWIKGDRVFAFGGEEHWHFAMDHAEEMGFPPEVMELITPELRDNYMFDYAAFLFAVIKSGWTRVRDMGSGYVNAHVPRKNEKYVGAFFDWVVAHKDDFFPDSNFMVTDGRSGWEFNYNEHTTLARIVSGEAWKDLGLFESKRAVGGFEKMLGRILAEGYRGMHNNPFEAMDSAKGCGFIFPDGRVLAVPFFNHYEYVTHHQEEFPEVPPRPPGCTFAVEDVIRAGILHISGNGSYYNIDCKTTQEVPKPLAKKLAKLLAEYLATKGYTSGYVNVYYIDEEQSNNEWSLQELLGL